MSRIIDTEGVENAFTQFLNSRKLRKTPERFAILHKALEINSHFEVDMLHLAIEKDGYHVSRATVYNTVLLLEEAGILRKNAFGGGSSIYEVARDNHIHLVCKRCGKIREIDNKHIESEVLHLKTEGFYPANFAITIFGLCSDCQC